MVKYRRFSSDNPDDIYFITMVTKSRTPFFDNDEKREIIKNIILDKIFGINGELIAYSILPDHIHLIIEQGDKSFSNTVSSIKRKANSIFYIDAGFLWQNRFWEHRIRDNEDLIKHIDYIHYNPVKHGYVSSPKDFSFTSFIEYVENGEYPLDWSAGEGVVIPGIQE